MDENLTDPPQPRRLFRSPLAVAVVAALVVGVTIGALARDDGGPGSDAVAIEEQPEESPATTASEPMSTTTSVNDETSVSTTATTTTVDSAHSTSTPESTPTSVPPAAAHPGQITGTATWIGRDPRAHLSVAGCPTSDTRPTCPSMVWTSVLSDGSFVLPVPPDEPHWHVAAYVTYWPTCVFACYAYQHPLDAVRSEVVTADGGTDVAQTLTVTARVVDLVVLDRNGDTFNGGGLMVNDVRCPSHACPDGSTQMFAPTTAGGATRIVLAPDVTYELTAFATGTGWPEPPDAWRSPDGGNVFWFSSAVTSSGAALDEGHEFYVDGAPA